MVDDRVAPALFGVVFVASIAGGLYFVRAFWGTIDAIGLVVGLVIGIVLLPAMSTPFFPSPPRTGGVLQQFVKIYMTISSMVLTQSVFYLKGGGQYVRKRIDVDGDTVSFVVDGERQTWKGAKQRLITFGRRPLGLAWSENHSMYQAIVRDPDYETDGGEPATLVDMDRLHRMLRRVNQLASINAAEKDAKDKYGGGDDGPGTVLILGIAVFMLLLGAVTVWFAMAG